MDKEGFAIVTTFKRLPYLLWGGVAIHCRHRNLAYIFWRERSAHIQGGGTASARKARVSRAVSVHYRVHPWRQQLLGRPAVALSDGGWGSDLHARERQLHEDVFR